MLDVGRWMFDVPSVSLSMLRRVAEALGAIVHVAFEPTPNRADDPVGSQNSVPDRETKADQPVLCQCLGPTRFRNVRAVEH